MGSYGAGRKTKYESIEQYHTINIESARVFGYQIVYSEQKNVPGKRPWILCPCCQRRCGLLYFRHQSFPVCRKCLHLIYPCQRESYAEKQRTYEKYILQQYGAFGEWLSLPKRHLSYEEADTYYQIWEDKISRMIAIEQEKTLLLLQMDRALSMS